MGPCEAFSYSDNSSQKVGNKYFMFMRQNVKRITTWHPGSMWRTHQINVNDKSSAHVAVSGSLSETGDAKAGGSVFQFDLHKSSPDHFAPGSLENLRVSTTNGLSIIRLAKGATDSGVEK